MKPIVLNRVRKRALRSTSTIVFALFLCGTINTFSQRRASMPQNPTSGEPVSKLLLLRIVRAEDERRWDKDLRDLFRARNANVRSRAALAAGRIGDQQSIPDLIQLLLHDDEAQVWAMAAFALGEIESPLAAEALLRALHDSRDDVLTARILEALGKIAAALPKEQEPRGKELGAAILKELRDVAHRRSAPNRLTLLLGITAVLRSKPGNAGPVLAEFLSWSDPRIRADAANALARLKLNDGNEELRKLLIKDADPIVRANAARVLGVTEDKTAFDGLLDRALQDKDLRVRVSAIRALGTLKDDRAAASLIERGNKLIAEVRPPATSGPIFPPQKNELLELANTLGRLKQNSQDQTTFNWFKRLDEAIGPGNPEVEIGAAKLSASSYLSQLAPPGKRNRRAQEIVLLNWRAASALAQGLGEIAQLPAATKENRELRAEAEDILQAMLDYKNSGIIINTLVAVHSEYAIPDVLRAYAAFKPKDLADVLRKHLKESDVIIRGAAADLLGELAPNETNTRALIDALPIALADRTLNDAALSILDALAKQKNERANDAIKTALDSDDYLVRRRAAALLKANGVGDFSDRIGFVKTGKTNADYERALARIGKQVRAVVTTTKGAFTIDLLPEDAPLTVDNFIQLARRNYFNNITFHRVVPNFVIQGGDPRGDGNGGPDYQIRCEINFVPYARGAVGMALSGKDTGGSQWFVTHSPQPHLDGGYTVFGNVVSGMNVVDDIARGEVIRSIVITEKAARRSGRSH